MARKNRKSKFKSMHVKDLAKNKVDNEKLELNIAKIKENMNLPEELSMEDNYEDNRHESGMEIEGLARKNKIRKNKLFQKRALLEERKRMKRHKRSPILISSKKMQIE